LPSAGISENLLSFCMMFRFIRHALGLASALFSLSLIADVELPRVWPAYRSAESFTAIGEYFGRPGSAINQAALRTQPDAREGYYWLTRTKSDLPHPGSNVRLEVTRQGSTEPIPYDFAWDVPAGRNAVFVGLTGNDWTDSTEAPVAWRLTVIAADGTILASTHSFLWDQNPS